MIRAETRGFEGALARMLRNEAYHFIGLGAAALMNGEIDWFEEPSPEQQTLLRRRRDLMVERLDPDPFWALLRFNLGVELGQVAVLALVLPAILVARKRAWFERTGVRAMSAAIVAAGLFWFVTRVFGIELI